MRVRRPVVGVMGSGLEGWDSLANPLGAALAALDVHMLCGGGGGVMSAIARSFTSVEPRGGLAIGILPSTPDESGRYKIRQGFPNPYIELPVFTPLDINTLENPEAVTRNHVNILTSDFVIALPGGKGTRNEIDLAIKFGKPLCLLGPDGLPPAIYGHLRRASTVDGVMEWLKNECANWRPHDPA